MDRLFSLTRALVARKRKIFALFFALAASIGLSWAQNLSGECGPELTWEFEEATGKLTISGTGTMLDYPYWEDEGLNSRITSVSLPEGLTDIGPFVFADCENLESITLPSGLTSIDTRAFMNCIALREITLPGSLTTLGEQAFFYCRQLESIKLPEGITTLGNDVFAHCNNLQSVTLPPSLTTLGESVFRECGRLESITLPDGLTSIGNNAFSGCHYLESITLPEGVTFIGNNAFEYCGFDSIKLPEGITTLGTGVFSNCDRLQSVTLPPSLTSIGEWAFSGCWNLASVTLPESVTTIGESAFGYCTSLTEFTNNAATPQAINANVFSDVTLSNITLNVPEASKAAYEAADVWKDFGTKATIPAAITKTITDNGMTYDIYDNGVVKVSGTGIVAARIFVSNDHDYVTSVKRFEFADDCKVYSFGEDWYMYYTSISPLEAVDIKTTLPFVAGRNSVFYRKEDGSDESVTVTITAPAIASITKEFVDNYGTPQHIIFNMPVTTFEKNWCSYLREKDTVTIPTGSLYHLPASYAFKDEYTQSRYDYMAADGMEDMFWEYEASGLVEGVDYTRTEEKTGVITAENETKVFGKAVVKYQAPQEAPATSWTFWRSDDFKTFPELENGSSHTCKDVTLKIVDGSSTIINMPGSSYITLSTSATNGILLIAPKGKIFKQVIALDRDLSTPFIWTGEADTVGISSNLMQISLIEFELDAAPALPEAVTGLVYTGEAQTLITAGEAAGYTFQYKVGDAAYSTDLPTATDAGSYTVYYKATAEGKQDITGSVEVSIAKAALTITAENKEVVYGFAAPGFSVSYYGLKGSDLPADVLTGELSYACDYTVGSNVASYDIVPSGQTSANYDITYVNGKLVVYKADPAFTAPTANTLTYNGGAQTLIAAGITEHGTFEYTFTPNDEESWNTALPQAKNADTYGVYYRIAGDANHNDYESADAVVVTIAKAALTATADDKSVIYGDDAPEYTVTYEGWQGEDDETVLTGTIAYACEYAPTSIVGEYTITPSGVSNPDYAITFINGKVTVNKAALTITADNKEVIYGSEAPLYTAVFEGWKNEEDESDLDELDYICTYEQGSPVGTYTIAPTATDHNYDITITDATLTVNQASVIVSGAKVQIAKFEDGTTDAVVLDKGILNGVKLNDAVDHITTASFSDATVGEHKTIRVNYELTGDAALLANYDLILTAEDYIEEGIIIENFVPAEEGETEKEDDEAKIEEGIEVYAYGYCDGSGYSLRYHLNSGNPDQYKIEFDDSRFEDVNWTNLTTPGKDGTIDIEIPVDMPTGDYTFTATFRDSRFDWLESNALNVTFHVNLPETYVTPMFDNTIALVDTCNCFTDIQWYHRADASEAWQPIAGATGYYYRPADGSKLTGEFFVQAKMNGVPTYTCGQADMQTLYGADKQQKAIVKAFPNPVVNTTTVSIEHSDNWEHALRVVNLMGVEIINTTFEGDRTTIDLDGHAQGNYMISVDGIVVKVMKQ